MSVSAGPTRALQLRSGRPNTRIVAFPEPLLLPRSRSVLLHGVRPGSRLEAQHSNTKNHDRRLYKQQSNSSTIPFNRSRNFNDGAIQATASPHSSLIPSKSCLFFMKRKGKKCSPSDLPGDL